MEIRKGHAEELHAIVALVKKAIADMENSEIHQWDDVYPDRTVLEDDLRQDSLYVLAEDTRIKGIIVLNEVQAEEYAALRWQDTHGNPMVIHRLCVSPLYKRQGIATKLLRFAETAGTKQGYSSIRLDAFTQNPGACRLYEHNGYEKRGIIRLRMGDFWCFEKEL